MRSLTKVMAVSAIAAMALAGCGRSDSGSGSGSSGSGGSDKFPKDALIGVSLPQKTSENWVLAENLF